MSRKSLKIDIFKFVVSKCFSVFFHEKIGYIQIPVICCENWQKNFDNREKYFLVLESLSVLFTMKFSSIETIGISHENW